MKAVRLTIAACALGLAAQAQYPGQYPGQYPPGGYPPGGYPPGSYPPGQYPGQRQPNGQPAPNGRRSRGGNPNAGAPTTTYGMLRIIAGKQFAIETDDHRIITYKIPSNMTVEKDSKPADLAKFAQGDHLIVDSTEDEQGYYTASAVRFDHAGSQADAEHAAQHWDLPKFAAASAASASSPQRDPGDDRPVLRRQRNSGDENAAPQQPAQANPPANPDDQPDNRPATAMKAPNLPDADDSGPPTLKRGAPSAERPAALPPPRTGAETASASTAPKHLKVPESSVPPDAPKPSAVQFQEDPILTKAREVAAQFSGQLPNFFCQQITTRYESDHPKTGWDALDTVTADVAYENGQETYKNIKVGGKPVNGSMDDISGTRSTGEFATMLDDLLNPYTGAIFKRTGTDTVAGRSTYVYHFEVARENSHWRIEAPAQLYYPAYAGSIWIDKQTSRVLRIEQQAKSMPLLFPFDTVESATDYSFVRLSTPQEFLLPVDAEVLSCVRGSSECARNKIEFRNYRKFGADTSITFEGKQQ